MEVLAAIAIAGMALVSLTAIAGQSESSVSRAHQRERAVHAAARELSAMSLWTPDQFRGHQSSRTVGDLVVSVSPEEGNLFQVQVFWSSSPAALLSTRFHARGKP